LSFDPLPFDPLLLISALGRRTWFYLEKSPTLPFPSIPSHLRHTAYASRLSHHSSNHLIFVVKKQRDPNHEWERERDSEEDDLSELLDFELDVSQIFKVDGMGWGRLFER